MTSPSFRWRLPRGSWPSVIVFGLPLLLFTAGAIGRRWITDDAFIDLRVVSQLLEGHGPVFNQGERVEAYTNPLWVFVLALVGLLGMPLDTGAVYLGIACSLAGLGLALVAADQLAGPREASSRAGESALIPLRFPLGALVYASLSCAWDFASSGLETGLCLFWLGGAYLLLVRSQGTLDDATASSPVLPGVLRAAFLGLGPLIRPDLAVFSVGFLATEVVLGFATSKADSSSPLRSHPLARAGLVALSAAALPMAYQVFRMGYFAALVPTTAIAKEASESQWRRGLLYLMDFERTYGLVVPVVLALFALLNLARRLLRWRGYSPCLLAIVPWVCGWMHALYIVRVGGDFMHGRLLLPPLFGGLLPVMVVAGPRGRASIWGSAFPYVLMAIGVTGWSMVALFSFRSPYTSSFSETGVCDERSYYVSRALRPNPTAYSHFQGSFTARFVEAFQADVEKGSRVYPTDPRRVRVSSEGACGEMSRMDGTGGTFYLCGQGPISPIDRPLRRDVFPGIRALTAHTDMGIVGYGLGSGIHVVDRRGLTDPLSARLVIQRRGRAGHEKALRNLWIFARFAEPSPDDPEEVVAARGALHCGALGELMESVTAPMGMERFLTNLRRSPRLTRLRIPDDGFAAYRAFCKGSP